MTDPAAELSLIQILVFPLLSSLDFKQEKF